MLKNPVLFRQAFRLMLLSLALAPALARAEASAALRALLARSPFAGEHAPAEILPGVPYDPALLSVVASEFSKKPARKNAEWEAHALPAPLGAYCPGTMPAHVKRAKAPGAPTFLILPGSCASFTRGSFLNRTAAQWEAAFKSVNLVTLPGYLSPDFLEGACARSSRSSPRIRSVPG